MLICFRQGPVFACFYLVSCSRAELKLNMVDGGLNTEDTRTLIMNVELKVQKQQQLPRIYQTITYLNTSLSAPIIVLVGD